jgi:hypothetical protein
MGLNTTKYVISPVILQFSKPIKNYKISSNDVRKKITILLYQIWTFYLPVYINWFKTYTFLYFQNVRNDLLS